MHINAEGEVQALGRNEDDKTVLGQTSNPSNISAEKAQTSLRKFSVAGLKHAISCENGDPAAGYEKVARPDVIWL
tara:strand:+ start:320 stop:544 length:225 start_codon:yes stop_codon:yes gene_type:complete